MFCRFCGNELPDNAKFCTKCGNSVGEMEPVIRKAESPIRELHKQEAPRIAEMPKEPVSKADWATASKLDKARNKTRSSMSIPKIMCIISGCLCGIMILFTIFGKTVVNSNVDNKKPSSSNNIKVEETVPSAPVPVPEPEPEPNPKDVGVADPRNPATWIYCTGEEEWYEDAISSGEDFDYDEWLYYEARLENNYDESGRLIIPDEEPHENRNYTVYVDQYAHDDIYVNRKNPVGYFERYAEDGYSGGLEIIGSESDNYMTFNFHLSPGQTGYYGYNWVELDFTITTVWLKNFPSHGYAIKLDENVYMRIAMYGTFSSVSVGNYCGVYDILLENAVTNYDATIMSDSEITGTYYCVYQEEYVGG